MIETYFYLDGRYVVCICFFFFYIIIDISSVGYSGKVPKMWFNQKKNQQKNKVIIIASIELTWRFLNFKKK